jgi:hypothetical protein
MACLVMGWSLRGAGRMCANSQGKAMDALKSQQESMQVLVEKTAK